jgi:hypothetical protein
MKLIVLALCAFLAGCGSYRITATVEYQSECKPGAPSPLACDRP